MYKVIKRLPNWFKIVENVEWKYNIADKDCNLLSKQ